jgi:hypothetical protein
MPVHGHAKAVKQAARAVPVFFCDSDFCDGKKFIAGPVIRTQKIQNRAHCILP